MELPQQLSGCIQVTEVVKYIVGIGELLTNRLLIFDGLDMKFQEFAVKRDPSCEQCGYLVRKGEKGRKMSIKVNISSILSHYTNNQSVAEVNGDTIGECLKHLGEQFPKLDLFDKDGKVLAHLGILINGEIAYSKKLTEPVKDGDELTIILMIGGG